MEFKSQIITPAIAEKYLKQNTQNRRVKNNVVLRYAKEMLEGRWKSDTAEFIKISKTGIVLDGQHRLLAIIKADISVNMSVAVGINDNVFDVLDTGSLRNAPDAFKIKKIKYANCIPSMISLYHLLKLGKDNRSAQVAERLSINALLEEYENREQFWQDVATKVYSWYESFAKILPQSSIGGFYARMFEISELEANEFMNQLTTGLDVSNKTISVLRKKLLTDRLNIKKIPISHKYALIIKAWNFYRGNTEAKILKFNSAEEKYPKFN